MRRVRAFPLQSCVMRVLFAIVAFTLGTTVRADGFSDVLSYLDRCRSDDFDECLERDLTQTIDGIMNKTGTYRINRYLVVTVRASDHPPGCNGSSSRNVGRSGDSGAPILNFFNALRVRYQPEMIDQPTEDVFEGKPNATVQNTIKYKSYKTYCIIVLRRVKYLISNNECNINMIQ